MNIDLIVDLIILIIVGIQFILIIILLSKSKTDMQEHVMQKLVEYDRQLEKNEAGIRKEMEVKFGQSRGDLTVSLQSVSEQLSNTITNFTRLVDDRFKSILDLTQASSKSNRDELSISLKSFKEEFSVKIEALTRDTKDCLEKNRVTVEKKLTEIQTGNEAKLDKMRETVDEKLQKTLEARLSASFKMVSDNLEKVQKGLGEMQNLASDVGDLKKVMTNVKTKGVLGEYQLGAILEEILLLSQYEKNIKTKTGSDDRVEFAVKIPSKEDSGKSIFLPIDSKLPAVAYEALIDAYNNGDKKTVDDAKKVFFRTVKSFAKDIQNKYIDPPNTTDFAIMFLPFEGEYAEVVRDPELFESIRRESKIIVTGPSTIAALLNALRVGFNSIAVDKNTSKIQELLSIVKKEFGNFENTLVKVKDKIDDAGKMLEKDVGVRTRAINRALNRVETVSDETFGQKLLSDAAFDFDDAES
ncbi:MAG: DNA recombination protein RmuC [Treponema sp.]|jgi:DNA recombination protein RmuC|nr:DNA recombination protein RmuC [Treponema sp.]